MSYQADPVTARYVEALFGLAQRGGALDAVRRDVERLAGELSSTKARGFVLNPRLDRAERLSKLEPLLAGLHAYTRNFVKLLFEKNREAVLVHLGRAFRARLLEAEGRTEGVVESARPLDAADISRIAQRLETQLGLRVQLENHVRPDVVGGVRVRVGSRMLDASIGGRLAALEKRLRFAPLAPAS